MKLLLLFLAIPFALKSQEISYNIRGDFSKCPFNKLYIFYHDDRRVDSIARAADGILRLHGKLKKPGIISFRPDFYSTATIWVDGGHISFTYQTANVLAHSAYEYKSTVVNIKGSPDTELYNELTHPRSFIIDLPEGIDSNLRADLVKEFFYKQAWHQIDSLITLRPASGVIPIYIMANASYLGTEAVKKFYDRLPESSRESEQGKRVKQYLSRNALLAEGVLVDDFAMPASTGEIFKLSSLKSKYILLDFWASWCGPCRAENPMLIELYQQYKDKGLSIVGISFDDDKEL